MSRIAPICRSRALVRTPRKVNANAKRNSEESVGENASQSTAKHQRHVRRPSTAPKPALGDATSAAAFEIHRFANAGPRGLRADTGVRRQWNDAYNRALAPHAPITIECARA